MENVKVFVSHLSETEKLLCFTVVVLVLLILFLGKRKKSWIADLLVLLLLGGAGFYGWYTVKQETGTQSVPFDVSSIPEYGNEAYVTVNDNVPYFTEEELLRDPFQEYGKLDSLGRCTGAFVLIDESDMPLGERGEIDDIKPSGWNNAVYDFVDQQFLYNRCHLVAWALTGENANPKNLITGTRYMNVEGMEPWESMTAYYLRSTGNHVLYRATPVFEGNNLVASGVLLEARSIEDLGSGLCFCVYCYNVQPGVVIDYKTGSSHAENS